MFEKAVKMGLLFDFYGKLLSDRQYTIIEMYYIHDLSLSEIGEQLNISRQGVHDILKRAEKRLLNYEEKLGLVEKFLKDKDKIKIILKRLNLIKNDLKLGRLEDINSYVIDIENIALDILDNDQEVK
ncbi:DNA-binding protein [Caloranaerobacter sp. TR13]|uniref:YlxM family DNA-binding protein n=1 Tax=Caloranaerobacter sp. TR13 TaxID=1302151 RepID=UPI0006D4295D|nr:YlxM family DNA-binding protein [Caloranaerobacter sp. TR13]KPU28242.1 DNA-binding protein [Caloranaerobacter sp. TR13]